MEDVIAIKVKDVVRQENSFSIKTETPGQSQFRILKKNHNLHVLEI